MGTIDKLAAAGFSPEEINSYRASEGTKLSQAGFTSQEITNYLGTPHPEPDMAEANKSFAQAAGNALADAHNTSNGLPSSGLASFAGALGKAGAQDAMDVGTVVGPLEAAANVATGAIFGFPGYLVAGAGGLAAKALGANVDPAQLASRVSQALTYQPQTGAGQRLASAAQAPLEWLNEKSLPAGQSVADFVADHGASPTSSKWAGAITAAAIQTLPVVLLGELGRKMSGERVTSADMQNAARQIAGADAKPDAIASVENSLRATYAQTGISPYTALEQTRIDPSIADEMKQPDVSVPTAFQPYMRREQIGVPVSDQMKSIRPLEAETPVPGPVEPTEVSQMKPETQPVAEMPQETAELAPAEITLAEGEKPEVGFGAASNPQNLESAAPVRTNTQLADTLRDALKQHDIDRAYQLYEQKIDNERNVIGNRAEAESLFSKYTSEDQDAITLMHSGLAPHEAIAALKDLGGRILQTDVGQRVGGAFDEGVRDIQMKTAPMAAGSDRAMAVAKDAANAMRKAQWQWSAFDDLLKRGYNAEQREKMWNAADEENDLRTAGIVDQTKGLGRLNDDERQTVETLQQYGNSLLQRARDVGMFQGEGVQYWTPRMIAMIGEDGEVSAPPVERASSAEGRGGNISTSAGSLKGRKHATTAETEVAAKAKFGEGAQVVRDIRTMPMAMARIEKAIAGRELVNRIKEIGLQTGQETVSAGEKPEFFTIDHPAFKTYRAAGEQWVPATEAELSAKGYRAGNGQVWKSNPNTVNEYDPVAGYRVTSDGKIERRQTLMERAPLYMSREFEGPLKAIMTEKSGAIYNGLMALKGKTMGVIMYSPLIHNMVEWGRALPALPGKVLTGRVYFEGNAAKHDPVTMRRALDAGLVPIGHRFFNQDITGLIEEPNIKPGRSLTAQALASPFTAASKLGLGGEDAAGAIKMAVDKAGDVWHNTLLWDRVADLQMGLYTNLERDMIRKGLGPQTSSRLAAHFANRYAGALPNEAMSAMARKFANLALFSRTFTLGNLGAMKDVFTGLPRDVQAQILRDAGEAARVGAVKAAQQKAIHAFVMDIALQYAGNAIMQNAMDNIQRDKSVPSILAGYAMRFKDYLTRAENNPLDALRLDTLFPQSQNEPGKENRIFFKTQPDGTAVYVRLPTGKIGEEFQGYLTSPIEMLKRKQGTIARPLIQAFTNDKGFGQKVYDENEPGLKGMLDAVGNITWNILQEQVPLDSIAAGYHLMSGHGDEVDALKVVGPLLGMTFSKGAPGGPEVGVMFDAEKRHQDEVTRSMPGIKQDIKNGDMQDAIQKMEDAHFTPQEQRATLKYAMNPQARLNRNRLAKFEQIAPLEDLERMQRMQEDEQQTESTQP